VVHAVRSNRFIAIFEFAGSQSGVVCDAAHRVSVNWICPWNDEPSEAIGHYDVATLSNDSKSQVSPTLERRLGGECPEFGHD